MIMNEFNITGEVKSIRQEDFTKPDGSKSSYYRILVCVDREEGKWSYEEGTFINYFPKELDGKIEKGQTINVKGCLVDEGPLTGHIATEIKIIKANE